MKILAERTEHYNRYLMVDMTERELYRILGYYSECDDEVPKTLKNLKAGATVDVSEMYNRLRNLRGFSNELKSAREMLTKCAEYISITDDAMDQIVNRNDKPLTP